MRGDFGAATWDHSLSGVFKLIGTPISWGRKIKAKEVKGLISGRKAFGGRSLSEPACFQKKGEPGAEPH